jgi:probable FeS assembly SUF system protein SufT
MRRLREDVVLARPVRVERVPSGARVELPAGARAQITQALGGSFTLWVDGQLVRLKGMDADAIGKPVPVAVPAPEGIAVDDVHERVWQALRTCYDPEIPVDIVELGLVYACRIEPMQGDRVKVSIEMTLTAPGCGMGEAIAEEACDKVLALPRVGEATVDVVFDPPWDRSRMSEAAKLTLGV